MPDETTILSLPLILPAQAQKHVTHNEALAALDLIVQLAVIDRTRTDPPALAVQGDRHIVAAGATGDWAGQGGRIALMAETGWQFTQPLPGWQAHVLAEGQTAVFDGLGWSTLSDGPLEVAQLGVSATADAVNRLVVASPATLFNHAGGGHQVKLNKAAPGETASLLFQTGFSGRAEMGTAGSDDFAVKVSADGVGWQTAFSADAATGEASFPAPLHLGGQAVDPVTPDDGTLWLNTSTGEVKVQSGGVAFALGAGGSLSDGDKGDLTVSGGGAVWTIEDGAVNLAKLADLATGRIIGRVSGGAGVPEALTGAEATSLLVPFSDSQNGLVPASGGGTTKFLRADGSFAVPPAGGGSPSGASGTVQYNGGASFAGAADVEIEGGQLRLPAIGIPVPPSMGGVKLFGRSVGGRLLPASMGPSGLNTALQTFFGRNSINLSVPAGNGTTLTSIGMAPATTGTATAANVAITNRHTRMKRLEYLVTTASTSAVVGFRTGSQQRTIGASTDGDGGFHLVFRWGPATGVATPSHRAFAGLRASVAAPTDVNPSTLTNMCGMGWDSGDANIQFMHNDGSGAATKIDLGSAFPRPVADRSEVYEIALFAPPGTAQLLSYEVTDLSTGAVATGTLVSDLPGVNQLLAFYSYMSVGGTSSVIGMSVMGLYIESDY